MSTSRPTSFRWLALLVSGVIGSLSSVSLAGAPTADVFGTLPAQTDAVLSPDGHWLAWMNQQDVKPHIVIFDVNARSEERRVGKECRSRWSPYHSKTKLRHNW